MIHYYPYIAYFIMLMTLFIAIRYCIESALFIRNLHSQGKGKKPSCEKVNEIAKRYHTNNHGSKPQISLEEQTYYLFSPYILRLAAIKSVAPGLGLCFTVISIMISFQIFSDSGDVKAMFNATSIGLGTTALGAITMVISKIMIDRFVIPASLETLQEINKQVQNLRSTTSKTGIK